MKFGANGHKLDTNGGLPHVDVKKTHSSLAELAKQNEKPKPTPKLKPRLPTIRESSSSSLRELSERGIRPRSAKARHESWCRWSGVFIHGDEQPLRAVLCKYRPEVCKMKKSKIFKLGQNAGLGGLFLGKILKVSSDFYFGRTIVFYIWRSLYRL